MDNFWAYFEVLAPSVGVGLVFWLAMRSIFRADRKERIMEAQVRDEVLRKHGDPGSGADVQGAESPAGMDSPDDVARR